jgi:hypothetical protein
MRMATKLCKHFPICYQSKFWTWDMLIHGFLSRGPMFLKLAVCDVQVVITVMGTVLFIYIRCFGRPPSSLKQSELFGDS